jgi:hypothetical protein
LLVAPTEHFDAHRKWAQLGFGVPNERHALAKRAVHCEQIAIVVPPQMELRDEVLNAALYPRRRLGHACRVHLLEHCGIVTLGIRDHGPQRADVAQNPFGCIGGPAVRARHVEVGDLILEGAEEGQVIVDAVVALSHFSQALSWAFRET